MRIAVSRVRPGGRATHALGSTPKPVRKVSAALVAARPFSQTGPVYKKKNSTASNAATASGSAASPNEDDPFDFAKLDAGIQEAAERLKETVARLRSSGGRFDPQLVENLRVTVPGSKKRSGDWAKLADVAQVIPKGSRSLTVIISEEAYVKAVSNAVQASPYSLNPQPSTISPLELSVPLPGPTQEGRKKDLDALGKAQERALGDIRDARAVLNKKLRSMKQNRKSNVDKVQKAEQMMEERTQKGNADVKNVILAARKRMQADL